MSSVTYKVQRDPATNPIGASVDDLKPYLGEGTPSNWQQVQSDIHSAVGTDDLHTVDTKEANTSDNTEPYYTRYGRPVIPPVQFTS